MADSKLAFLVKAFPDEKVCIEDDGAKAVIFNPFGGENLEVYYDEADFHQFYASFSFQHRHLDDEEAAARWIKEIVSGK